MNDDTLLNGLCFKMIYDVRWFMMKNDFIKKRNSYNNLKMYLFFEQSHFIQVFKNMIMNDIMNDYTWSYIIKWIWWKIILQIKKELIKFENVLFFI